MKTVSTRQRGRFDHFLLYRPSGQSYKARESCFSSSTGGKINSSPSEHERYITDLPLSADFKLYFLPKAVNPISRIVL